MMNWKNALLGGIGSACVCICNVDGASISTNDVKTCFSSLGKVFDPNYSGKYSITAEDQQNLFALYSVMDKSGVDKETLDTLGFLSGATGKDLSTINKDVGSYLEKGAEERKKWIGWPGTGVLLSQFSADSHADVLLKVVNYINAGFKRPSGNRLRVLLSQKPVVGSQSNNGDNVEELKKASASLDTIVRAIPDDFVRKGDDEDLGDWVCRYLSECSKLKDANSRLEDDVQEILSLCENQRPKDFINGLKNQLSLLKNENESLQRHDGFVAMETCRDYLETCAEVVESMVENVKQAQGLLHQYNDENLDDTVLWLEANNLPEVVRQLGTTE